MHRNIVQLCATVYQFGWSLFRIWKDGQMTMMIIVIIMMVLIDNEDADKNGEDDNGDNDGDQAISIENIWRDHCWLRLRSSPWAHLSSSWDDGMMITMINNGLGPLTISFSGRKSIVVSKIAQSFFSFSEPFWATEKATTYSIGTTSIPGLCIALQLAIDEIQSC